MRHLALWVLLGGLVPFALAAKDWDQAPALPAPTGNVVNVSTESALQSAVQNLQSGDAIVIQPGTYNLSNTLWVDGGLTGVQIRGSTGDPDDVVLRGAGMNNAAIPHGIWVGDVTGILIADLTIREVYYHPIQLAGELGCQAPVIYHCKLIDAGEQFIKGTTAAYDSGVDDGIVEYCVMEYTNTCRDDYTNGVDIHGGSDWIIRHNLFRRILADPTYAAQGNIGGPAILMWKGGSGTISEGNTFIDCERGIAYGLFQNPSGRDHSGGIIRNNFFYRSSAISTGDAAIIVWDCPNTKVYNNTVFIEDAYPNAIEYRFATTTGVDVRNNLTNAAIVARDGATGTNSNNFSGASSSYFAAPSSGDLRLTSVATAAIDAGATIADVTDDYDGLARPSGAAHDLGGSEFGGTPANQPPVANAAYTGNAVINTAITLDGSGSYDPDSGPGALAYAWSQVSGPAVSITGATQVQAGFTPTTAGTYVFRLTVTDTADTDTDDVTIDVLDDTLQISTADWSMSVTDAAQLPQSDTRSLVNGGSGTLTVSVSSSQAWLDVTFDNGSGGDTLAPGGSGTVTATITDVSGLPTGTSVAVITVTGDDGVVHQVQIDFRLTWLPASSGGLVGSTGVGGGCVAGRQESPAYVLILLAAFATAAIAVRNRRREAPARRRTQS